MILHLSRPEKAVLVSALCVTHKDIQPTMGMDITLDMANEALNYPGIIDLMKLACEPDVIISLLTLVNAKNSRVTR